MMDQQLQDLLSQMTLEEKIGQMSQSAVRLILPVRCSCVDFCVWIDRYCCDAQEENRQVKNQCPA